MKQKSSRNPSTDTKIRPTRTNKQGIVVDRTRSLAAQKAAATRRENQSAPRSSWDRLGIHHKIVVTASVAVLVLFTFFGIANELSSFAVSNVYGSFIGAAGKCMDNNAGQAVNKNRIQQWACDGSNAQTWSVQPNGALLNRSGKGGYCLDVPGNTKAAGTALQLWKCNNTKAQKFKVGGGVITAVTTGFCVTVKDGSTNNGAQLIVKKCDGGKFQKWSYISKRVSVNNAPTRGSAGQSTTQTNTNSSTSSSSSAGGGSTASSSGSSVATKGNVVTVANTSQGAVQSAVNAAGPGNTVSFPAGTYVVNSTIGLKNDVLYRSSAGAVLKSTNGSTIFNAGNASGIVVDGLTFDGGNLQLGSDGTVSNGTTVVNSTFRNVHSGNFGQGQALFLNRLASARIENNAFRDNGSEGAETNAIIGYNMNGSSISNNSFSNNYQGMHIEPQNTGYGNNLTINNNTMTGLNRMGIEVQGYASNLSVSNNTISSWAVGGQGNKIGLSLVTRGNGHATVTNNRLTGRNVTQAPAIEFMGSNGAVTNNVIDGFGNGISISEARGTTFSGNVFTNIGQYGAFGRDGGYTGGETIGSNTINGRTQNGYNL